MKLILIDLANHINNIEEDIAQLRLRLEGYTSVNDSMASQGSPAKKEHSLDVGGDVLSHGSSSTIFNSSPHFPSYSVENLSEDLNMFEFDIDPQNIRHFGSSSSRTLVAAVMDIKKEYTGDDSTLENIKNNKRPEFWAVHPVGIHSNMILTFWL